MSMAYYLQACGRADLQVVPLYDTHYAPRDGDLIVLEPSRRFFETQRFFDALGNSKMPHSEIRVGPVLASTIYLFDPSVPGPKNQQEELTLTQLRGAPPRFENDAQETASTNTSRFGFPDLTRRPVSYTHLGRQHRNPLLALPSNDGSRRVFCGEFFLGSRALASCLLYTSRCV